MSAVWRASRAAVRRRRLQTMVIGVVVGLATTMVVIAVGLLATSSGPFDQAYARQSGAHLVAAFDAKLAPDVRLEESGRLAGVAATAGPFGQVARNADLGGGGRPPLRLVIVGRGDPGGDVDRLNVWKGRWATGPGEIVLNQNPSHRAFSELGATLDVDGTSLEVVGYAYSMSQSGDAWVTPAQLAVFRPTTAQMLYRFTEAATEAQVDAARATVTAGLPSGALIAATSYLPLRTAAASEAATFVPFLVVFGCLGLAVAVLIVANVVSGAVVAGFRHIGMLKALGFTPSQVLAIYLAMVSIPAIAGCLVGIVLGNVLAGQLLSNAFRNLGAGDVSAPAWVSLVALLGMPVVVALSALVPALRARSLSAAQAISAGSAQHAGRALRVQRWLSGTRLPRAVSLGLGLPFARPARSAMTMAAVVLGVMSVTLAAGLAKSLVTYSNAADRTDAVQVQLRTGVPGSGATTLSDPAIESKLRSVPGTAYLTASSELQLGQVGTTQRTPVIFYRGDSDQLGYQVLKGRWLDGPGQIAVSERFLIQRGLAVGDVLDLELEGRSTQVRIAASVLQNDSDLVLSNWETLALFAPDTRAELYEIRLAPGTDEQTYLAAVRAVHPGLVAIQSDDEDPFVAIVLVTVSMLTLMLGTVAALGVFNTVVLNTRERRRDLGMLKSIGMTPGQVTVMVVTSMAALGALGGLVGIPLGVLTHRVVIPVMARAAQVGFPDSMLAVYQPPLLLLLALAGIAIAALGALLPARSAARTTIAEVLHTE